MLHGFVGIDIDRDRSLRLFKINAKNTPFEGLTRKQISAALRSTMLADRAIWRTHSNPTIGSIKKAVNKGLQHVGLPTLIVFGAKHRRTDQRCIHCAIAVGCDSTGIRVLDPMGRPPKAGQDSNVHFSVPLVASDVCHVEGCYYKIDSGSPFSVLIWDRHICH